MQQAVIDFTELQGLLESKFINPGKIVQNGYDQNCDPTKILLQNTDDSFFDRMHRFIRLWRVLGWSVTQLDQAIMSDKIGAGKLDDDSIFNVPS